MSKEAAPIPPEGEKLVADLELLKRELFVTIFEHSYGLCEFLSRQEGEVGIPHKAHIKQFNALLTQANYGRS